MISILRETDTEYGSVKLVRVGWNYHIILWDQANQLVKTILPSDRVVKEWREAKDFNEGSIRYVSRGRKKETAIFYYSLIIRAVKESLSSGSDLQSVLIKHQHYRNRKSDQNSDC